MNSPLQPHLGGRGPERSATDFTGGDPFDCSFACQKLKWEKLKTYEFATRLCWCQNDAQDRRWMGIVCMILAFIVGLVLGAAGWQYLKGIL